MLKKEQPLKGKKVLMIGLGRLGGGVATVNWLLRQGARVTVTDHFSRKELAGSIRRVRGKAVYVLGGYKVKDITAADMVVVNPFFPLDAPHVAPAFAKGKDVQNEATLFFQHFKKPTVAITGTRGKTTTTAWTSHFLNTVKRSRVVGNSPTDQFLKMVDKGMDAAVIELPSFQLDLFRYVPCAPDVAVVTNVLVDHVSWHGSVAAYARAKSQIFLHQRAGQHVVLNADNTWTPRFLKRPPASRVWLFSSRGLKKSQDGVFYKDGAVWEQIGGRVTRAFAAPRFGQTYGAHNLENLLAAALGAHLMGAGWREIGKAVKSLPQPKFRQETVLKTPRLTVINDTTATSPDGGIAALRRFAPGGRAVFIAGGTDRDLDFRGWAKEVRRLLQPNRLVLLSGSATDKMLMLLGGFGKRVAVHDTLEACVKDALARAGRNRKGLLVFSPGAKSFEKFKNEYDRGERFNRIVKRLARR